MARALRIQYPGAIYHVMNRGDRREDIYLEEKDRFCFLETLSQACEKTGWQVHAYCLMSNHFHLLIETPEPNLSSGMKWLLQTYSSRFNQATNSSATSLAAVTKRPWWMAAAPATCGRRPSTCISIPYVRG